MSGDLDLAGEQIEESAGRRHLPAIFIRLMLRRVFRRTSVVDIRLLVEKHAARDTRGADSGAVTDECARLR